MKNKRVRELQQIITTLSCRVGNISAPTVLAGTSGLSGWQTNTTTDNPHDQAITIMKMRASTITCLGVTLSLAACGGSDNSRPQTASVSATGVTASGEPVVGVTVTVTDSARNSKQSTITDATGKFTVSMAGKPPFILTARPAPFAANTGSHGLPAQNRRRKSRLCGPSTLSGRSLHWRELPLLAEPGPIVRQSSSSMR
jgi:hypothetical protein